MERSDDYYVLFASPASAAAYKAEVERLFQLSKMYRPNSLTSPIPPPPGFLIEGEDIHAAVEKFTLALPSDKLSMRTLLEPFSPYQQSLISNSGYKALCRDGPKPRKKVLVHVEGPMRGTVDIVNALVGDRDRRGWGWETVRDQPIRQLVIPDMLHEEWRESRANSIRQNKRRNRWLVEFAVEDEAKRFVRAWHRTRLPVRSVGDGPLAEAPRVHAELVW